MAQLTTTTVTGTLTVSGAITENGTLLSNKYIHAATCVAGTNIGVYSSSGPSVSVNVSNGTATFTFNNLKGEPGDLIDSTSTVQLTYLPSGNNATPVTVSVYTSEPTN